VSYAERNKRGEKHTRKHIASFINNIEAVNYPLVNVCFMQRNVAISTSLTFHNMAQTK